MDVLYWVISIAWTLFSIVFFCLFLTVRWKKLDPFDRISVDRLSILHSVPGNSELGYLDLKFSIIRHSVAFLATSFIFFFVKIQFILYIVLVLSSVYCWFPIFRYINRKKHLQETMLRPEGSAVARLIAVHIQNSTCTFVNAIIIGVLQFVLFALRPI